MVNMICIIGMGAALAATVARVVMRAEPALIAVMLGIVGSIALFIFFCNRYKLYRIASFVLLITLGDILFPIALFFLDGADSGMAAYFVVSLTATFFLARGKARAILITTNIIWVSVCYAVAYSYPHLVRPISPLQQTIDNVQSFIVAGLFVGFLIIFQSGIYDAEKLKVEKTDQELIKQDKLLHAVNYAAAVLLTHDENNFEGTLRRGMSLMAESVGVTRIYVWKNVTLGGALHYHQIYEWCAADIPKNVDYTGSRVFSYMASIPEWEVKLAVGQSVRGKVCNLSPTERERLAPYGILSILVIPVILQDKFWGFVSYDDCLRERDFSEDEESILRSGSLLLANAIIRDEYNRNLQNRLKQQEVMSAVSQSFISREELPVLINSALRRAGEFLGVTRVTIVTAENVTEEGDPYAWNNGAPPPEAADFRAGVREIAGGGFPEFLAQHGSVPAVSCADTQTEEKYSALAAAGLKSFIMAPLYANAEYWGALVIEEWRAPRAWSESDLQLAGMVGGALAGAISRDLMDKERGEALAQAVQASKAKGDFLSNMSHEMRTPMNAIIGMTTIAKTADDMGKKDYCLRKIEDASAHLLGVINDILDMSKIEANKLELSAEEFNFERMLQKVVGVVNFRVEEKHQSFSVYIDKNIPRSLIGDDQRLAQVVTNLLSNSVKFTPERGSIHLDASLTGEKDGLCTIQIKVVDSGIGISAEQKSRLFNSFEQAETSTSRKFGGTGLGLAISKRIVELMDGKIWVDSTLGLGADFTFSVSLRRGEEKPRGAQRSDMSWKNMRVLAVDDDMETRYYFSDIARRFGFACDTAAGAEEAFEMLKEHTYDLYFVDWMMPGQNGVDFTLRLREVYGAENPVVILISSAEWNNIEDSAKKAGIHRFLSKPLFPSEIADCINECIGLDSQATPELTAAAGEDDFAAYRVLLAEDVEINREILAALLEPTGIRIDCAENGAEAVAMFSAAPENYDMIFMDVQMPEMDGYEATRQIRALNAPTAATVPIIAMTANVFREDIEKCLASGMNGHVGKPLDFDDVIACLRENLPSV
ncbi:MAG: response regulator [Gracilibacteraceae bacterium]|nr:response regulator [Gracilibacteraceae bacterium]